MGHSIFDCPKIGRMNICFKILMGIYHEGEKFQQSKLKGATDTSKSEISNCAIILQEEGLIEEAEGKKKRLTSKGYEKASELHQKYEISLTTARLWTQNEEEAVRYAEFITLNLPDEAFIKNQNKTNVSLTKKFETFMNFRGKDLCKKAESGTYPIDIFIDKIVDAEEIYKKRIIKQGAAEIDEPDYSKMILTQEDVNNSVAADAPSMSNYGFLHSTYIRISNGKGFLHLHRTHINREVDMGGRKIIMKCKAVRVEYYNGKEFVECPFVDDDVDVPLDHFNFVRRKDKYLGKLLMRFTSDTITPVMPTKKNAVIEIEI